MWDKPTINRLPGDRLHLRHGPIAVIVRIWAAPDVVRQAHRLVTRHFPKILPELGDALPKLKQPIKGAAKFDSKVAQRMADAVAPFSDAYVTPMAAVAGAVAEEVLRIAAAAGPIDRAYVCDGNDIAIHVGPGHTLTLGAKGDVTDTPAFARPGAIRLTPDMAIAGIATTRSGGRALSLGIADAVTVFATSASAADAAATMIANAVDVESKAITRKPAIKVDPETDLGDLLVTTKVGRLTSAEIGAALAAGAAKAEAFVASGLAIGAVLRLQDEMVDIGHVPAQP